MAAIRSTKSRSYPSRAFRFENEDRVAGDARCTASRQYRDPIYAAPRIARLLNAGPVLINFYKQLVDRETIWELKESEVAPEGLKASCF